MALARHEFAWRRPASAPALFVALFIAACFPSVASCTAAPREMSRSCAPNGEDAGVFPLSTYRDSFVRVTYVPGIDDEGRIAIEEVTLADEVLHRVEIDSPSAFGLGPTGDLFSMWSGEVVLFASLGRTSTRTCDAAPDTCRSLTACDLDAETCRSLPLPAFTGAASRSTYDYFSDGRYLYATYVDSLFPYAGTRGYIRMDLREAEPTWQMGSSDDGDDSTYVFPRRKKLISRRAGLIDDLLVRTPALYKDYRILSMDWPCAIETAPLTQTWDLDLQGSPFIEPSGEQVSLSLLNAAGDYDWYVHIRRRLADSTIVGELEITTTDDYVDYDNVFEFADGRFGSTNHWDSVFIFDSALTTMTSYSVSFPGPLGHVTHGFSPRFPTNYPGDTTIAP